MALIDNLLNNIKGTFNRFLLTTKCLLYRHQQLTAGLYKRNVVLFDPLHYCLICQLIFFAAIHSVNNKDTNRFSVLFYDIVQCSNPLKIFFALIPTTIIYYSVGEIISRVFIKLKFEKAIFKALTFYYTGFALLCWSVLHIIRVFVLAIAFPTSDRHGRAIIYALIDSQDRYDTIYTAFMIIFIGFCMIAPFLFLLSFCRYKLLVRWYFALLIPVTYLAYVMAVRPILFFATHFGTEVTASSLKVSDFEFTGDPIFKTGIFQFEVGDSMTADEVKIIVDLNLYNSSSQPIYVVNRFVMDISFETARPRAPDWKIVSKESKAIVFSSAPDGRHDMIKIPPKSYMAIRGHAIEIPDKALFSWGSSERKKTKFDNHEWFSLVHFKFSDAEQKEFQCKTALLRSEIRWAPADGTVAKQERNHAIP
ncbi:hypothetical protein [uncultured Chitinophaga sp.]|uniref:hypothetical protein n=1 Tax=uncultured Chitinophaga sp. TaxID=339340 RepID=UPI0025FD758C|nr:hypothetical protein [uncultured Chitinophaga sp.]